MKNIKRILAASFSLSLLVLAAACNGEPREGFYDRDHHRYYHEHGWRECGERDDHCR